MTEYNKKDKNEKRIALYILSCPSDFISKETVNMVLNKECVATIDKSGVTVGCQKFSLNKILELAKAVEEVIAK